MSVKKPLPPRKRDIPVNSQAEMNKKTDQLEIIDLLNSKELDLSNENGSIIAQFRLLATQIQHRILSCTDSSEKRKHGFRLSQIRKAIESFENYPERIRSGLHAQSIKGIGKGIGRRIDEILETGTLAELTQREFVSEYTKQIQELTTVTGIGEVRAKQLVDDFGITGVADLQERFAQGQIGLAKNQLTHHMVIGLRWYPDIQQKIPRQEIQAIEAEILQPRITALDPELQFQICGSYRRERPLSGDIDLLMTHPGLNSKSEVQKGRKYLPELLDHLITSGFIVDSLTDRGNTKYMGVCQYRGPDGKLGPGRRIDIRFVPYESWNPALMYFTGSGHFNKIFRAIANQRGLTLNEYGLYLFEGRKKGEVIPVQSEEEIFQRVGVKYLTPKERDLI